MAVCVCVCVCENWFMGFHCFKESRGEYGEDVRIITCWVGTCFDVFWSFV